ncbi:hypothetical protein AB0M02_36455 [Actinoplanes sp. NPDC051861]|uniref:hypothetical protein n=1 Tax=Actinoplanes sp. NPDC051861 TaxID=3155170 RepID=UPI003412A55F
MTTINWSEYAALSRQLGAEIRADAAWRDESHDALDQARDGLDGMNERLARQRARLLAVAPSLPPAPDSTAPVGYAGDIAVMAVDASAAMDRADEAATRAEWWAGRPPLLPGMSVPGRAAVVHGVLAVAAFLVSFAMFAVNASRSSAEAGDVLLTIIGFPAAAFGLGLLVLATAGRPRRLAPGEPPPVLPFVLGLAVSYGVMITCWIVFVAVVAAAT